MTPFQTWLLSLDQKRTVLLEVDYLHNGEPGTLYWSNRAFISTAQDSPPSTPFDEVILSGLTYSRDMQGQLSGSLGLSVGSVQIAATPEVSAAAAFQFTGQAVRVYLGDQRWRRDDFQLVALLTAEHLQPASASHYVLTFRTQRLDLSESLNTRRITQGANQDAVKPVCFGYCRNIRPVQVDEAGLVWAVHDGAITQVHQVRVNGAVVSASVNHGAGTFTLSAPPNGILTADVTGEGNRIHAVLLAILARLNGIEIDHSSFALLPAVNVGLYSRTEISVSQALDAILKSVAGYWGVNRLGNFQVGVLVRPATENDPQITDQLTPDDILNNGVAFDKRVIPASEIVLKHNKNYAPQAVPGFEETFLTCSEQRPDVVALYPDAERKQTETLLSDKASAESETQRLSTFFDAPLKLYTVNAFALPFAFNVGQRIGITYPHFNMHNGIAAVIVAILDDPLKGVTRLKVLTHG